MMKKTHLTGFAVALLAMACSVATAQQQPRRGDQPDPQQDRIRQQAGSQGQQQLTDFFTGKLMLLNQMEVEMSKFAQQQSASPEIKQFAQMLEKEHSQLNERLRQGAPQVAAIAQLKGDRRVAGFRGKKDPQADQPRRDPNVRDRDADRPAQRDADRPAQRDADRPAQRDADRQAQGDRATANPLHQVLDIERQATQNYLQSTKQMLQRHQGQDFSMGYLGFQIGSHTWALAELNAMKSVGDEQFQNLVSQATGKIEDHLQKAKQLAKKLEDKERSQNQ